jgi:hypothetical protein
LLVALLILGNSSDKTSRASSTLLQTVVGSSAQDVFKQAKNMKIKTK